MKFIQKIPIPKIYVLILALEVKIDICFILNAVKTMMNEARWPQILPKHK